VEYLTSEEAGQPLGGRFAWPVGLLVNEKAGMKGSNGVAKMNGKGYSNGKAMNGNGVANGNGNVKKDL
jgi:dihydroceramidase